MFIYDLIINNLLLPLRDAHLAALTVKLQGKNSAVLQTQIAWLIVHWINLTTMSQLMQYAVFTRHQWRVWTNHICISSRLH